MGFHPQVRVLLCLLAVSLAGCARPAPAYQPDPDVVLEREKERVAALVAGDFDRLAGMLSPTLSYTHSNAALDSKETFLKDLRSGQVVYRSLTHHDVQVRFVKPGVAVVNGMSDVVVTVGGQDQDVPLRFTIVYVEQDGEWLFEAWHSVRRPAP